MLKLNQHLRTNAFKMLNNGPLPQNSYPPNDRVNFSTKQN